MDPLSRFLSLFRPISKKVTLVQKFQTGLPTVAVCPNPDESNGFSIVLLLEVQDNAEQGHILRIAKLDPKNESNHGELGSVYWLSKDSQDNIFWEHEARLYYIQSTTIVENDQLYYSIQQSVSDVVAGDSFSDFEVSKESMMDMTQKMQSFSMLLAHKEKPNQAEPVLIDNQENLQTECKALVGRLRAEAKLPDHTVLEGSGFLQWTPSSTTNDIQLFHKILPNSDFSRVMARTLIDASPIEIKYLVKKSKNREKFDPMCRGTTLVQTVNESTMIVHFTDTKYAMVREFCILRHDYTDADGTVYLASNSVDTSLCPPKNLRGLVLDSGFLMESRGKGKSMMTYVVQVNLNTWAPLWLANNMALQQVYEVLLKIRQHFRDKKSYEFNMNNDVSE